MWEMIAEIFHLQSYPTSWEEFCGTWLRGKGPVSIRLIIFMFSGFAWALWTTRNKIAIEKMIPKTPTDVLYIALSLMQKQSVKLKEKDKGRIMQIKHSIACWLKNFKPNEILMSDVFEIQSCNRPELLRVSFVLFLLNWLTQFVNYYLAF